MSGACTYGQPGAKDPHHHIPYVPLSQRPYGVLPNALHAVRILPLQAFADADARLRYVPVFGFGVPVPDQGPHASWLALSIYLENRCLRCAFCIPLPEQRPLCVV